MAAAVGACATVFGLDDLQDRSTEVGGQADAAATTPDAPAPTPCAPMGQPPPIVLGAGGERLDFALDSLDPLTTTPGFDLDCKWTTDLASSTCLPDDRTTDKQIGDGDGGVDNSANSLLRAASSYLGAGLLATSTIAQRMRQGWSSTLFVVSDIASFDDDDEVYVFAYPAAGLLGDDCVVRGVAADAGADAGEAGRDGGAEINGGRGFEDQWCVDDDFVGDGFGSKLPADRAWIRGGRLHAHFARLDLPLTDDVARVAYVHLENAYLTAKVVRSGEHFVVTEGNVGGAWRTDDFIRVFGEAEKNAACRSNSTFATIADTQLCPLRDLRSSPAAAGPARCDALSIALGFTGYQVRSQAVHGTKPQRVTEKCPGTAAQTFRCPGLSE